MASGEAAFKMGERWVPLDMTPDQFRSAGHQLVDRLTDFLASFRRRRVTSGEKVSIIRSLLGSGSLPERGTPPELLIEQAASLLLDHSLFNGHPRFWGYITSSPAPIGILGELLASAVNPNVGAWILSPVATEMEAQTVRWIAEMIGYPADCGGLLLSGGNMANFLGFLAARKAKAGWDIRKSGMAGKDAGRLCIYCSSETHTWIHKAADLFGLGTESIRWIAADGNFRMDTSKLRRQLRADQKEGTSPFLLVGNAGTVSTGALDPLPELAHIAREHGLWFHVDGAYGGFAAALPDAPVDLKGIAEADSVAVDPHKWLYAPLEAGCALVRDGGHLLEAFRYRPPYYHFEQADGDVINYFEHGLQNSRGFRALKVWLALRQAGREGYVRMISEDIRLAEELFRMVGQHPDLQAFTRGLSIVTFRFVPGDLKPGAVGVEDYLNRLNVELLTRLQSSGEAFISNAVVGGAFVLRACIVNFRTRHEDIYFLPELVTKLGLEVDREMRPQELRPLKTPQEVKLWHRPKANDRK